MSRGLLVAVAVLAGQLCMARTLSADSSDAGDAAQMRELTARRDEMSRAVADARAGLAAAEARGVELQRELDASSTMLAELSTRIRATLPGMSEAASQIARDTSSATRTLLTRAERPGHTDTLARLAALEGPPKLADLESLALELLDEATELARVTRFETEILTAEGERELAEVVRVGPFVAISEDRYLSYDPGRRILFEQSRQPPSEIRAAGRALFAARSGYIRAPIDPSRGIIFALYGEKSVSDFERLLDLLFR